MNCWIWYAKIKRRKWIKKEKGRDEEILENYLWGNMTSNHNVPNHEVCVQVINSDYENWEKQWLLPDYLNNTDTETYIWGDMQGVNENLKK